MIERLIFTMVFSGVLGGVTGSHGLGWINENGFNPLGATVNIIGVIIIVIISNLIWR